MGTFAKLLKADGATIPDSKKKEFEERVEQLFQAGGMMEMKHIQLCGKTVHTIVKASMHEYGMDFYYSYFDDVSWENAGFDKKNCHIYSNKVGGVYFIDVIVAAYVLEGLYLNGPALATVDEEQVSPLIYADWIYYLFRDEGLFAHVYKDAPLVVKPVATERFLGIHHDDMILFWKDDGQIQFSDSLLEWFKELRERFDQIKEVKVSIKKPLEWITGLMKYADKNYYHIYTINDFYEETIAHPDDQRYLVLWKLYDEMLHDPEMKKAGSVIFVPDGPEYENRGVHYPKDQLIRPLRTFWDLMSPDKRNNKARVTFRRYMALVANKELRMKVFGF